MSLGGFILSRNGRADRFPAQDEFALSLAFHPERERRIHQSMLRRGSAAST
jgi:hypothetical protein